MKHVELVDSHRKDMAMVAQSEDSSPKKHVKGLQINVDSRNRWLFGALALACVFTLQALLPVDRKDITLTLSFLAFAVALPLNILLVLNTYAEYPLPRIVRLIVGGIALAGTFMGMDTAFWHASWVGGIVFAVVSVISFVVAWTFFFGLSSFEGIAGEIRRFRNK